jgi:hypothetical protein
MTGSDPKQDIRINFCASAFRPHLSQANTPGGIALLLRSLKSRAILFKIVPMLPAPFRSVSMA